MIRLGYSILNSVFIPDAQNLKDVFLGAIQHPEGFQITLTCIGEPNPLIPRFFYLENNKLTSPGGLYAYLLSKVKYEWKKQFIAMYQAGKIEITGEKYPVTCFKEMLKPLIHFFLQEKVDLTSVAPEHSSKKTEGEPIQLVYKEHRFVIQNYEDLLAFANRRKTSDKYISFSSENPLGIAEKVELATYFESAKMFIDLARLDSNLAYELILAAKEEMEGMKKAGVSGTSWETHCASSSGKMIGALFTNSSDFDQLPHLLKRILALYVPPDIAQHYIDEKIKVMPILSHRPQEQKIYLEQKPEKPNIHSTTDYVIKNSALVSKVGLWKEKTKATIEINQEPNNHISFWSYPEESKKFREELGKVLADPNSECILM